MRRRGVKNPYRKPSFGGCVATIPFCRSSYPFRAIALAETSETTFFAILVLPSGSTHSRGWFHPLLNAEGVILIAIREPREPTRSG